METISIEIISALPGFYCVCDLNDSREIIIDLPIIAWRIETHKMPDKNEIYSYCLPLTCEGDAIAGCIGVQNPDMTVTVFHDSTYPSIMELQKCRYPIKEASLE